MTDDTLEFTRRKVLGAVGATGAAGALSGAGTVALFNDTESSTDNTITAGKLDLKIDWTEHYNGKKVQDQGLTDDPGPIFTDDASKESDSNSDSDSAVDGVLDDVKPGDSGEATISLHNYHNPAWVHMGGELTSWDGNDLEEPEEAVDDTDGDDEGELADQILVDVWYDGTKNDADGGNNELEDDELVIASGTLRDVMDHLDDGILLADQTSMGGSSSGGTTKTAEYCGEFKRGPQEEQCIDCLPCSDPSVLATPTGLSGKCYTGSIPDGATHVTLKAAKGCYLAELTDSTTKICLPDENPTDQPNQYGEISNATFYRCPPSNGGDGDNSCFPNSTTQYIGFSWELPKGVDNRVQGDSVEFDLKFHAQQCRHNDDPTNPFA